MYSYFYTCSYVHNTQCSVRLPEKQPECPISRRQCLMLGSNMAAPSFSQPLKGVLPTQFDNYYSIEYRGSSLSAIQKSQMDATGGHVWEFFWASRRWRAATHASEKDQFFWGFLGNFRCFLAIDRHNGMEWTWEGRWAAKMVASLMEW